MIRTTPLKKRLTATSEAQPGVVVLVGAGDQTLSAAPRGEDTWYRDAARIVESQTKLAREFARQLRSKLNRADFTVKLFGSRATGEADAESDLDLLGELKMPIKALGETF